MTDFKIGDIVVISGCLHKIVSVIAVEVEDTSGTLATYDTRGLKMADDVAVEKYNDFCRARIQAQIDALTAKRDALKK